MFVTQRKARVELPSADLDPDGRARLSYQQTDALFSETSGGTTLHELRHSAPTHWPPGKTLPATSTAAARMVT